VIIQTILVPIADRTSTISVVVASELTPIDNYCSISNDQNRRVSSNLSIKNVLLPGRWPVSIISNTRNFSLLHQSCILVD
jgi:hypothetical protein